MVVSMLATRRRTIGGHRVRKALDIALAACLAVPLARAARVNGHQRAGTVRGTPIWICERRTGEWNAPEECNGVDGVRVSENVCVSFRMDCGRGTRGGTYSSASLLRSAEVVSSEPTPTASVPRSGKNPCSPMIAYRATLEYVLLTVISGNTYRYAHPKPVAITLHDLQASQPI